MLGENLMKYPDIRSLTKTGIRKSNVTIKYSAFFRRQKNNNH